MKYDMDELMKEIYTEEIRPNDILNQKTFHKMKESGNMSNFIRFRKTAVAAAAICVISIGGVSAIPWQCAKTRYRTINSRCRLTRVSWHCIPDRSPKTRKCLTSKLTQAFPVNCALRQTGYFLISSEQTTSGWTSRTKERSALSFKGTPSGCAPSFWRR